LTEEILYPSVEELKTLYDRIVRTSGGEHGYLSTSNLEYLLDTVKDVGERLERRQAIIKKAAFLLYNVIVVHPFLNGNKRTAFELAKLFLRANGFGMRADAGETYGFLLGLASGDASESEAERWLATHLTESESDQT